MNDGRIIFQFAVHQKNDICSLQWSATTFIANRSVCSNLRPALVLKSNRKYSGIFVRREYATCFHWMNHIVCRLIGILTGSECARRAIAGVQAELKANRNLGV